jgi:hypothetical protein
MSYMTQYCAAQHGGKQQKKIPHLQNNSHSY